MIEIVFSDSACGSLKAAQHWGEGEYAGRCVGAIVSHADGSRPSRREKREAQRQAEAQDRRAWERGAPMGGNTDDVFGLDLALDVGEIAEAGFRDGRLAALRRLFGPYPHGEGLQAAGDIIDRTFRDLETLQACAAEGEPVRIWYSDAPAERCGLCWFMDLLDRWKTPDVPAVLVKLPAWEDRGDGEVTRADGWGEIAPGDWSRYAGAQRTAPAALRRACAGRWARLREENAPLRVVLNGRLVSAPEDVYDDVIRREIAREDKTFREAEVIGRVLGRYRLGIRDGWVALRIDEMIRRGELEAVSNAAADQPDYHRTLRKRA